MNQSARPLCNKVPCISSSGAPTSAGSNTLGPKVIAKLGASAQSLPTGEIYTSLETGRLDATEFSFPEIDALLGLDKLLLPGRHQPAGLLELTINKDLWESWSDDQRMIVDMACKATTEECLQRHAAKLHETLAKFKASGVEILTFPAPVLAALRAATDEVLAEESAKDPVFKQMIGSYQVFSTSYDAYQSLNSLY